MMKKENIERFLKLLNSEEISDKIKDMYLDLLESHIDDDLGVKIEIILSLDGEVDNRFFTGNSTRMDVYEGNSIVVAAIRHDVNITDEMMGEIVDVLSNDVYEEFVQYLYGLDDIPEEEQEEYLEENLTWDNFYDFDSIIYGEIQREAWENNVDYYGNEEIDQKLYECIQQLENLL
jgi:hypothetical protein